MAIRDLASSGGKLPDLALLLLRLQLGGLLITHGYPKLIHFSERMDKFADPFGIGSAPSLVLVIFAEFFCSILVMLGLGVRLAVIPIIITMLVVIFYAHWDDPFSRKELPLAFLITAVTLLITGSGKHSLDYFLGRKK
jgi:putative oxidoreductase